jgi:predicted nucleic acid-binding protein
VIRAIVDTNVLLSALIAPTGYEALILLAIKQGLVKASFPRKSFGNTLKSWLDRNSASRLMKSRHSSLCYEVRGDEIEKPEPLASSLLDPGDDKFLACAKVANVDFIVTGNKPHPATGVRSHPRC